MDRCNTGDIERRLMRLRGSVWTGPALKGREASDSMNLPNEDQWDETTCGSAVCQHPQCWTSLRRIERGHPRILDSSSKSSREVEDKLPSLTIVNIMDTCLWSKQRVVQRPRSEFTFPKERSLLWKPTCRRHGRSPKALRDKGVTSLSSPPTLSVLNLNEAKLPFSEDVGNLVVTWVPEETEKNISWPGKRKKPREKAKPSLYFSGRQYASTYSRSPGVIVPPPSPVHFFDPLSSQVIPLWAQVDMLPRDLLEECFLAHEKTMTRPEVKIELTKMRKNLPTEKSRPDSAISPKMYLTIHRITLQRPSLRYPEHLRKLQYNLKRREGSPGPDSSGFRKQPQRKMKTSTKKQEAKKEAQIDVEVQRSMSQIIPSVHEAEQNLEEQEEEEKKAFVKHASVEETSDYDLSSCYTDYSSFPESPVIYEPVYEDIGDVDETMVGMMTSSQNSSPRSVSGSMDKGSWNPDLKLLRILQAHVEEDENHLSRAQSEASLDA
ncbi:uncharacterized protein C9orf43 homolog isoform X1 [Peromyscus maniculatus bairdii]|uniref:uncharacterized protein C9orf43 homolog isoform X1 n=2 Tax=Peromyscus maniculatus bairdii TaxID=230844 RepID=UPI00077DDD20|nr:uncharacterized protein C9orf43 homolog isoform X1 [Peromyscus maniculatus bairdii]